MYIYVITNLINGKKYVGQTINEPQDRWIQHKSNIKGYCSTVHKAMIKYGFENFHFDVIDESANNINELNDLEEFYISMYDTFKGVGYNLTSGGEGFIRSEETKKRMSEAKCGTKNPQYGKKLTEEHKKKIGMVGEKHPLFDKTRPEETRKKISETLKGKSGIQCPISKKIIQIDKNTGEEIACWFSMAEVQRELGISHGHISNVCRGKRKSAGGFIWIFL